MVFCVATLWITFIVFLGLTADCLHPLSFCSWSNSAKNSLLWIDYRFPPVLFSLRLEMLLILFSVGKNLANPSKPSFKSCNSMKSLFMMVITIFPSAVQTEFFLVTREWSTVFHFHGKMVLFYFSVQGKSSITLLSRFSRTKKQLLPCTLRYLLMAFVPGTEGGRRVVIYNLMSVKKLFWDLDFPLLSSLNPCSYTLAHEHCISILSLD